MRTIDLLLNPAVTYGRYAFAAVAAVALVCSLLSVVVVLKRMAFIGQGISHAGFGGYALAMLMGLGWRMEAGQAWRGWAMEAVLLGFCLATAIGIGLMTRRRKVEADTAIGILLVAGMAGGVLLLNLREVLSDYPWYRAATGSMATTVSWEPLLFGSPWEVSAGGVVTALAMAAAVIAIAAMLYKELLFFSFDETSARVFGVRTAAMHYLLLLLVAVVVVVGMRLVGFILISAMLVVPGAAGLQLSRRIGPVLGWSAAVGVIGSLGGLVLAVQIDRLRAGASIVAVLLVLWGAACLAGRLRSKLAS